MGEVYVFTSADFNYLPKVRALSRSLKKYHPELKFVLILCDEMDSGYEINAEYVDEVLPASKLGIPKWKELAFGHDVVGLSTAIKPFAMMRLLSRPNCSKVIYLDPDIVLFSRFDDILETIERANLVLTPRQTSTDLSSLPIIKKELLSLTRNYGLYNLGFLGVNQTKEGKQFVEWWSNRTYHFCRKDIQAGMFYDQRWLDFVPILFRGVEIIKSSRYNVAPWNIHLRKMTGNLLEGIKVDGEPLGFYHFSSGAGTLDHSGDIKKKFLNNASLLEIDEWYEKETESFTNIAEAEFPWAYGVFSNGEPISQEHKLIYDERVDLQAKFPDPFDCSHSESFYQWCNNARIDLMSVAHHIARRLKKRSSRKQLTAQLLEVFRTNGFSGLISWVRLLSLVKKKIY